MAVKPNVVLGAIGLVVALVTGAYVAGNWRNLTSLERYEASIEFHQVTLPDRGRSLSDDASGNARFTERHTIGHANLTLMSVDLTWQESTLSQHQVQFRVLDPRNLLRGTATHEGGASGIHLDLALLSPDETPEPGAYPFEARPSNAASRFEARWPAHPETQGTWTYEIVARAQDGFPGGSIYYSLHVTYERYEGTFQKVPAVVR